MSTRIRVACVALVALTLVGATLPGADLTSGMNLGKPELKSAGALTFGPNGILFIADSRGGSIFAIDTGERGATGTVGDFKAEQLDAKIASRFGTTPDQIVINDLAVSPYSGKAYLSVSRGKGPDASAALVTVDAQGNIADFADKEVRFAQLALDSVPSGEKQRQDAITDMAYSNGRLVVAGLSNEEFASRLRVIPFPFQKSDAGASVEIFHGSHGKLETKSPVRTFALYNIGGQENVLAAYTCTPLVTFPVDELQAGKHVKGNTVAELGNRNRPIDMVVYQKGDKNFILMSNSSRGVMKVPADNLDKATPITEPVKTTAGVPYETMAEWKDVAHLDRLDKDRALLLMKAADGSTKLEAVALP